VKQKAKKNYEFSGADLISAASEGLEALRSKNLGNLRTTTLDLPKPAPKLAAQDIRKIRMRLGASQAVFARLLNIPTRTAIAWENGERRPSGAALKLLHIAQRQPEVLVE
jgi:putative transcriptional regulator